MTGCTRRQAILGMLGGAAALFCYGGFEVPYEEAKVAYPKARVGDLWLNDRTGEVIYLCSTDTSTGDWVMIRGIAGTAETPIEANDRLLYVGNGMGC